MKRFLLAVSAIIGLAAFSPLTAADQIPGNKGKNAQERKDDQRVKNARDDVQEAQKKLQEDQKELAAAGKELDKLQDRVKKVTKELQDVRKEVEAKLESSMGLQKLLDEQAGAQKRFDEVARPLLDELKKSPAYETASKTAESAKSRLKSLREDKTLPEKDRLQKVTQANLEALAVSKLERETLDADPKAKEMKGELSAVQQRVSGLRDRIRTSVESDSEFKTAKKAFDKAKDDIEKAETRLTKLREEVSQSQRKLAQEQAQLQKAQLQDKRNEVRKPGKN